MQFVNVIRIFKREANTLFQLFWGLLVASFGIVVMVHSDIGLFPWGTLQEGLSRSTGLSFGVWSQIIGIVIVIILVAFKYQPGVGTLVDVFYVGFCIDFIESIHLLPYPHSIIMKLFMCIIGLFILSYGMAIYMKAGLGTGPRDGLMLFLMEKTNKPVVIIKTSIEILVTILGLMMGGPFGIGTVLIALLGGKVLQWVFRWTGYDPNETRQKNFNDFFKSDPVGLGRLDPHA